MARKNLKVSEIVHEELEVLKRRDESFDDVLKRELGIIPTTVSELTTYSPDALREAASTMAHVLRDEDRYRQIVTEHDEYYALNYDSTDSGRTITQIRFLNSSPQLTFHYRNARGELAYCGTLVQEGGDDYVIADFDFVRPDTGELVELLDSFMETSEELDHALRSLQNAAYERWG